MPNRVRDTCKRVHVMIVVSRTVLKDEHNLFARLNVRGTIHFHCYPYRISLSSLNMVINQNLNDLYRIIAREESAI